MKIKGKQITVNVNDQESPNRKDYLDKLVFGRKYGRRRLTQEDLINFYDLGYYSVEDYYETNPAIFQPEITPTIEESEILTYNFEPEETLPLFTELDESIFAIPLEDFQSAYFKIYKGNPDFEKTITVKFPIDGNPDYEARLDVVEEWTDKGLKLSDSQAENLIIKPFGAMYNSDTLDLKDMTDLKATLEKDYMADGVEFTPSKKMDVFLMPTVISNSANFHYANGLTIGDDFSDYRKQYDLLNGQLQLLPRDYVLGQLLNFYDNIGSYDTYQQNYQYFLILKLFDNTRAHRRISEVIGPGYVYSNIAITPEDLPFEDIYQPDAPDNETDKYNISFTTNFGFYWHEDYARLKAVIYKDNTWYYIWSDI